MNTSLVSVAHFLDDIGIRGWLFVLIVPCGLLIALGVMERRDEGLSDDIWATKKGRFGACGFFGIIALEFFFSYLIPRGGWEEVKPRLFSKVSAVSVEGIAVSDPTHFVAVLRQTHYVAPHHSHPLKKYLVHLQTSAGPLDLYVARDAYGPTEYWVFNPTLGYPDEEVGRAYASELVEIPASADN